LVAGRSWMTALAIVARGPCRCPLVPDRQIIPAAWRVSVDGRDRYNWPGLDRPQRPWHAEGGNSLPNRMARIILSLLFLLSPAIYNARCRTRFSSIYVRTAIAITAKRPRPARRIPASHGPGGQAAPLACGGRLVAGGPSATDLAYTRIESTKVRPQRAVFSTVRLITPATFHGRIFRVRDAIFAHFIVQTGRVSAYPSPANQRICLFWNCASVVSSLGEAHTHTCVRPFNLKKKHLNKYK